MKPLIFLLLLFLSNFCFSQPASDSLAKAVYADLLTTYDYRKNNQSAYDACKLGVDSAQRDLKNGILRYFFVGHALPHFVMAETYISKKYGITPEFPGCSSEADIECYNLYIDKILTAKYGANFWERAWKEVDSLQEIGQLDRPLSYKGNVPAMHKDLFRLIKKSKLMQKTDSIQISCTVIIDTLGNVAEVRDWDCTPKFLEKDFVRCVRQLKNWFPAINYSKKKNSEMSLFFLWSKEMGEWWLKEME
jgi:hypothetical protein